jgi:hypothetical protein
MLNFDEGHPFSQGACPFLYRPATEQETTPRIFVTVQIEGLQVETAIDTGGAYFVCDPEIADLLGLDPADGVETDELNIRGYKIAGTLHRLSLRLLAEEGKPLQVEATAFIPRLQPYQTWALPSFMGLLGCLERIRFAVDPVTNIFYFGPIDEEG